MMSDTWQIQDSKCCILWRSTQILSRRSLLSKHHKGTRYMYKCYFIYFHEKSTSFPMPVSKKLTSKAFPAEPIALPAELATVTANPTAIPAELVTLPAKPTALPAELATMPEKPTALPAELATVSAKPTALPAEPTGFFTTSSLECPMHFATASDSRLIN